MMGNWIAGSALGSWKLLIAAAALLVSGCASRPAVTAPNPYASRRAQLEAEIRQLKTNIKVAQSKATASTAGAKADQKGVDAVMEAQRGIMRDRTELAIKENELSTLP
jgi:outer membrane murein-binding lipoprotein Lpp